jgi:hypothetical protein
VDFVRPFSVYYVTSEADNLRTKHLWQSLKVGDNAYLKAANAILAALAKKCKKYYAVHLRLEKDWKDKGRNVVAPEFLAQMIQKSAKKSEEEVGLYIANSLSLSDPTVKHTFVVILFFVISLIDFRCCLLTTRLQRRESPKDSTRRVWGLI